MQDDILVTSSSVNNNNNVYLGTSSPFVRDTSDTEKQLSDAVLINESFTTESHAFNHQIKNDPKRMLWPQEDLPSSADPSPISNHIPSLNSTIRTTHTINSANPSPMSVFNLGATYNSTRSIETPSVSLPNMIDSNCSSLSSTLNQTQTSPPIHTEACTQAALQDAHSLHDSINTPILGDCFSTKQFPLSSLPPAKALSHGRCTVLSSPTDSPPQSIRSSLFTPESDEETDATEIVDDQSQKMQSDDECTDIDHTHLAEEDAHTPERKSHFDQEERTPDLSLRSPLSQVLETWSPSSSCASESPQLSTPHSHIAGTPTTELSRSTTPSSLTQRHLTLTPVGREQNRSASLSPSHTAAISQNSRCHFSKEHRPQLYIVHKDATQTECSKEFIKHIKELRRAERGLTEAEEKSTPTPTNSEASPPTSHTTPHTPIAQTPTLGDKAEQSESNATTTNVSPNADLSKLLPIMAEYSEDFTTPTNRTHGDKNEELLHEGAHLHIPSTHTVDENLQTQLEEAGFPGQWVSIALSLYSTAEEAARWIKRHRGESLIDAYLAHTRSSANASIVFFSKDIQDSLLAKLHGRQQCPPDLQASPINTAETDRLAKACEMLQSEEGEADEEKEDLADSLLATLPHPVDVDGVIIDSNECRAEELMELQLEKEVEEAGAPPQEVEKISEDIELSRCSPDSHQPIGIAFENGQEVVLAGDSNGMFGESDSISQTFGFLPGNAISSPQQWAEDEHIVLHNHHHTHTHHQSSISFAHSHQASSSSIGVSALESPQASGPLSVEVDDDESPKTPEPRPSIFPVGSHQMGLDYDG